MTMFRLTISLEHAEPAVSRTLEVSDDIRLYRLHQAIQAAMGWEDSHLYEFNAAGQRWARPDPYTGRPALPVASSTLAEVLDAAQGKPFRYVYDFGDDWAHTVTAELLGDQTAGHLYPRLVDPVIGRCPPEDAGGIPGYEDFLKAISDPTDPDHEDMSEWIGEPFDPHTAPSDELRLAVLKLAKRWQAKRTARQTGRG